MIKQDIARVVLVLTVGAGVAVVAQHSPLLGAASNGGACSVGHHSKPVGAHSKPVGSHSKPVGAHSKPVGSHSKPVGQQSKPCPEPHGHDKPPKATVTSTTPTTAHHGNGNGKPATSANRRSGR